MVSTDSPKIAPGHKLRALLNAPVSLRAEWEKGAKTLAGDVFGTARRVVVNPKQLIVQRLKDMTRRDEGGHGSGKLRRCFRAQVARAVLADHPADG